MGLSVAISGAIVLSVLMLILMSMTGIIDKIFTIGDVSTQIAEIEKTISKTDISLETLFTTTGKPKVNFTLNNDDTEKLWNFDDFNVIVEYESASDDEFEELLFSGVCSGVVPAVGNWCIEGISGDFIDEGIINEGESAEVWTQVSQNLVSGNARVTVSTDNGEVAMLPAPKRSWFDASPVPPAICEFATYGRTFVDTDTGITYVCDPTKDKWLSVELIHYFGDESNPCNNGQDVGSEEECSPDWGNGVGAETDALEVGQYLPYNATIIAYAISWQTFTCTSGSYELEIWGSGSGADDENYFLVNGGNIATGLTAEVANGIDANLDVPGDQYVLYGVDNNCPTDIGSPTNWAMNLFLRWHHDDP